MGINISTLICTRVTNIIKPRINDIFKQESTTKLCNKEKIQFMGYCADNPYYLFCFEENIFYLKIFPNEGFGICNDFEELKDNIIRINNPNKFPNESNILIILNKINTPLKNTIYHLDGGLKIGHINSTYSRDELTSGKTEYSEYLLVHDNNTSILSYNFIKGYSIINKIYSPNIFYKNNGIMT